MDGIRDAEHYRSTPALLALLQRPGVGPRKALALATGARPPSLEDSWEREVMEARGLVDDWVQRGIQTVGFFDPDFPPLFRTISNPPVVVWVRGDISAFDIPAVAVVGTREPTKYGVAVAEAVSAHAVTEGFGVVSGLARGIDTVAHRVTLNQRGRALAVLAGGLDSIYPAENKRLAQDIVEQGGALLSETRPGIRPRPGAFIDRDRLQSALSQIVFICQTGRSGGTMHTAKFAVRQGRPIFCPVPPADMSEKDEGPDLLIRTPGTDLPTLIKEWSEAKWKPGQLTRNPVATGFTGTELPSIFQWLRNERNREPSSREMLPAAPPVQQELLPLPG